MSLNDFKNFIDLEKKYSKHTVNSYIIDLKEFNFFLKKNGSKLKENLNYSFVRKWIVELSEKGLSKRTINRKTSSLKSYFNFLISINKIDSSPLKNHKNLKIEPKIVIPFNQKELKKVFEIFENKNHYSTRDSLIIDTLYSTGIRRNELINLKTKDIYFDKSLLKVKGKRNKERLVPVLPSLLKRMKIFINDNPTNTYFFESKKGKKISPSTIYRVVTKYFRLVSTKNKISPHVIRHSFATHMVNNGADINSVKEILGHSSLSSTQIYTKIKVPKMLNDYMSNHPREKS